MAKKPIVPRRPRLKTPYEDPDNTAPPLHTQEGGTVLEAESLPVTSRPPRTKVDPKAAKKLEAAQAEAFEFAPVWQGEPLLDFGLGRQALARRLILNNMPIPEAQRGEDLDAHMPDAWAVLYLCSHTDQEFAHLRADPTAFWAAIEAWAEEHCPRPLWLDALELVGKIWTACKTTEATTPRHPARPHAGN